MGTVAEVAGASDITLTSLPTPAAVAAVAAEWAGAADPGSILLDVSTTLPAGNQALALQAWDDMGGLDVLVNNAAIPKRRLVQALTLDEVRETMRVNFESPVRMTLAVLPRMLERDRGVVVNVGSFGGRVGIPGEAAYCSSKFALSGWSESMAVDLWHTGVEVRLILPGAIATEIWDQPGNDDPLYQGDLEPAEDVAAGIVAAIEGDAFEHYLPDLKGVVEFKTSDIDSFLAGSAEAMRPKGDHG